jgi:hypothetical protein
MYEMCSCYVGQYILYNKNYCVVFNVLSQNFVSAAVTAFIWHRVSMSDEMLNNGHIVNGTFF